MFTTLLLSFIVLIIAFGLIAIKVLLVKGGRFRGTCSSNNPFMKGDGGCFSCGRAPDEACKNELLRTEVLSQQR